MTERIAQFEKVSMKQFMDDWICTFGNRPDHIITEIYSGIRLPERKTRHSAGHDFHVPYGMSLRPGETAKIPTGIRCRMDYGYVMLIFPRSSLGIRKQMFITNTVPVIDADYVDAENEGHIFICIKNCGGSVLELKPGEAFAQSVFVPYGVADNKEVTAGRTGGIGSTTEA